MVRSRLLLITGIIAILVAFIALFSGGMIPTGSSNHDPVRKAEVDISLQSYNRTTADMTLEIPIHIREHSVYYESPQLCLYDRNGTVLYREALPTINNSDGGEFYKRPTITVDLEQLPKYILIDHPGLRNDPRFDVELLELVHDSERSKVIYTPRYGGLGDVQDRFDFPRTNETGKCG